MVGLSCAEDLTVSSTSVPSIRIPTYVYPKVTLTFTLVNSQWSPAVGG